MSTYRHHRKKARRSAQQHHFVSATAQEERALQQALQSAKMEASAGRRLESIPWGPVFYPTQEEFAMNPLHYVEKIRPIAEKYGICKIVPPKGWDPSPHFGVSASSNKEFQTKRQDLKRLQEGVSFGDGEDYTADQYQRVASQRTQQWKDQYYPDHDLLSRHDGVVGGADKLFSAENLERDYWEVVETQSRNPVVVEYGNDVDTQEFGSGFPLSERGRAINGTKVMDKMNLPEPEFGTEEYYCETWWNLNNIPCAEDSVLRHVRVAINGINVPWLYFGSLFTTFCWHNEDNYLYSVNYHHRGAPKQWYGVPGSKTAADGHERVFKSFLSMQMREMPDLLHHITTMFSPRLLQNANVPICKLLQHEGEFVITFPRAFHGGFSLGPNVGEAVNFATHDWIAYGRDANERYRTFARPSVFSHDRLTFTMAHHLKDQKAISACKLLLEELERVVEEELEKRAELLKQGVQDVSKIVSLPKNRLEQLDAASASYDDKRLCHYCKHVCFFSAVACQCSQTKVSCLRHSHFMCRCPTSKKYFMLWSNEKELLSTLDQVRSHLHTLQGNSNAEAPTPEAPESTDISACTAPGVKEDLELHKGDEIFTGLVLSTDYNKDSRSKDSRTAGSTPSTSPATLMSDAAASES